MVNFGIAEVVTLQIPRLVWHVDAVNSSKQDAWLLLATPITEVLLVDVVLAAVRVLPHVVQLLDTHFLEGTIYGVLQVAAQRGILS